MDDDKQFNCFFNPSIRAVAGRRRSIELLFPAASKDLFPLFEGSTSSVTLK